MNAAKFLEMQMADELILIRPNIIMFNYDYFTNHLMISLQSQILVIY